MELNGIDCASYQAGLIPGAVPCDFVIVKATQGTRYVNPDYERLAMATVNAGKLLGIYHYAAGGDAVAEAAHFVAKVGKYQGRALLVLDWEGIQNSAYTGTSRDAAWVKRFRDAVHSKTGVWPLVYVSQAVMNTVGVSSSDLWVAQYASNNDVYGYQNSPWKEGAYKCAIRQYTSCGRLDHWNGRLDLNKFYGDAAAWAAYAKGEGATPEVPETPKDDGRLTEDGWCGPATVSKWQQVMGTHVDGVVSGQAVPDGKTWGRPNLVAVEYGRGGSQLIRAVQGKLGCDVDGYLGPDTIKAIQSHLGVTADGWFGPATVAALQRRLNAGAF